VANAIRPYAGLGGGVETRAIGAIDVSLWDLLARHAGLTLATLLGGAVRQTIPVYNTCAGPGYVARTDRQQARNWGLSARGTNLEDLDAFLHRPAELASELLTEGFRAMKIWPFDRAAEATGGNAIGTRALSEGVGIVAAIRDAVGADMDIMVELHGLWNRPAAVEICEALAPYKPAWVEDPVRPASTDAFIKLAGEVAVPIAAGETCVGRTGFYPLLASGAIDVATVDIGWTGGLTEARKVASLADMFGIGLAPHDCTGPVMLATAVQLTLSQPNGLIQEVTRAFLGTWYRDLVEGLPPIDSGQIVAGDRPGHGVELKGNLADLPGVTHRVTSRT
jgi:L-alanine-DL-glutamate epimerase-like enolase superfamily enzyme